MPFFKEIKTNISSYSKKCFLKYIRIYYLNFNLSVKLKLKFFFHDNNIIFKQSFLCLNINRNNKYLILLIFDICN